jgi:hypothetical protein
VDSIRSGFFEPYIISSKEAESNVIVTGIPRFNELNTGKDDIAIPINVWQYEDASISNINKKIYEIFDSETEPIIDYLEDYFDSNVKNCNSSQQVDNIIAAGYINLLNEQENSVASQFLKKYYLCQDIDSFKQKIENLLKVNKWK